ncbi:MAG: molecular chaperone HtpG [Clostridia bacterium]|nr:molecular chaperone HtpG [Clostridia bacterium]
MSNKQFKAESKRLLDLMINSIYTNKEIFLRELISNASDAIDKLYYRSLTDKKININRKDLKIKVSIDKEARKLIIEDNGLGMTEEELDNNLGTIAKSGSLAFKSENEKKEDINIIGQFGVGFYSAFMVSDLVEVESKSVDSDKAYCWSSKGVDGYEINPCDKETAGTKITLHIKEDSEEEKYSQFLDTYTIQGIIKKYSDYISYPITMDIEHTEKVEGEDKKEEEKTVVKEETINSMIPLWKKDKKKIKEEEYNSFYTEKFYDYEKPLKVIHSSVEGQYKYDTLLYIPSHLPFDYYTKEYEKGLQLYANGVLIMNKCSDLLPDYFGFVKGLVDSDDLSLNISREILQHDRQLRVIAKNIENKIKSELENLLKNDREKYEEFFKNFGVQLKYGTYADYGMNKEKLQDLLLFYSSTEKKLVTLKEYVAKMKEEQTSIYYASGESVDKIDLLPQVEILKDKGYEILYLTENVDEFVFQVLMQYEEKSFKNVCSDNIDLDSKEEKEKLKKKNEDNKEMLESMKELLKGEVQNVRFTHRLKNHPICLTSEGAISLEMEKTLNAMPNNQNVKAQIILEINEKHEIANKLKNLFKEDKESFEKYTKVLYAQARLIEGLSIENPTEISNLICEIFAK